MIKQFNVLHLTALLKPIYVVLVLLVLTSCNFQNIEIKGTAPGMKNATVTITDGGRDNVLFGENIVNGEFTIAQQPLKNSGYYTLNVKTSGLETEGPVTGMRFTWSRESTI